MASDAHSQEMKNAPKGSRSKPHRAAPSNFAEPSYLQGVVGFLQSVVPKSIPNLQLGKSHETDTRERIVWLRFEQSGVPGADNPSRTPPYLLLAYQKGFQVWDIHDVQDIHEVVSRRGASLRAAHILAAPHDLPGDKYATSRPILAFAEHHLSSYQQGLGHERELEHRINFISLRNEKLLEPLHVRYPVTAIESSPHAFAIGTTNNIYICDPFTLQTTHVVSDCFLSSVPSRNPLPFALHGRFLAYPTTEVPLDGVGGGVDATQGPPDAQLSTMVGLAQKTGSNLVFYGGKGVQKVSDLINGSSSQPSSYQSTQESVGNGSTPGALKVIDVSHLPPSNYDRFSGRVLAHFIAQLGASIAHVAFNPSGVLLFTSDPEGHDFNVFHLGTDSYYSGHSKKPSRDMDVLSSQSHYSSQRASPSPSQTREGGHGSKGPRALHLTARHVYILHRGLTTASVVHVAWSYDSRWVAVTSERGTTHMFPIHPRGGRVSARTHGGGTVVNTSRFLATAGIDAYSGRPEIIASKCKLKHSFPSSASSSIPPSDPSLSVVTGYGSVCVAIGRLFSSEQLDLRASVPPPDVRTFTMLTCGPDGTLTEFSFSVADLPPLDTRGGMLDKVGGLLGNKGTPRPSPLNSTSVDEDDFVVSCTAQRVWHVCRHLEWTDILEPLHAPSFTPHSLSQSDEERQDAWLSQLEVSCYNAPHRRLWMGPQFSFKLFKPHETGPGGNSAVLAPSLQRIEDIDCHLHPILPHDYYDIALLSGGRRYEGSSADGTLIEESPLEELTLASSCPDAPILVSSAPDDISIDILEAMNEAFDSSTPTSRPSGTKKPQPSPSSLNHANSSLRDSWSNPAPQNEKEVSKPPGRVPSSNISNSNNNINQKIPIEKRHNQVLHTPNIVSSVSPRASKEIEELDFEEFSSDDIFELDEQLSSLTKAKAESKNNSVKNPALKSTPLNPAPLHKPTPPNGPLPKPSELLPKVRSIPPPVAEPIQPKPDLAKPLTVPAVPSLDRNSRNLNGNGHGGVSPFAIQDPFPPLQKLTEVSNGIPRASIKSSPSDDFHHTLNNNNSNSYTNTNAHNISNNNNVSPHHNNNNNSNNTDTHPSPPVPLSSPSTSKKSKTKSSKKGASNPHAGKDKEEPKKSSEHLASEKDDEDIFEDSITFSPSMPIKKDTKPPRAKLGFKLGSPEDAPKPSIPAVKGLAEVLGKVEDDTPVHRVHSNVSLANLTDALEDLEDS